MIDPWPDAPPPVADLQALPCPPRPHPVRVLHVITRLEAGAGGNTLLSAEGMDPLRYEVWIAGGGAGPLWERARAAGLRVVELPHFRVPVAPLHDVRTLVGLVRLIRRQRFDVVHVHSAKAAVLGRVAAALCRVPVVICTIHGRDPWWPAPDGGPSELRDLMPHGRGLFRAVEKLMRPLTDSFVAVSPTVARDAVRAGIAAAGRTTVAPSAIDLDELPESAHPQLRRKLGLDPADLVIGSVGRLDRQKAPLDFVRMAAQIAPDFPQARFVIIGEGELFEEVRRLAEALRVPLALPGFRSDAARLASCFDVYVVTSRYEGVGRGVTEAMASARPVVATSVDGLVDLVAHGSTGLLVAPGDVSALAAGVAWLLRHPEEAGRMGRQASERVRALFSRQRMCALLDAVYQGQLGQGGAILPTAREYPAADAALAGVGLGP